MYKVISIDQMVDVNKIYRLCYNNVGIVISISNLEQLLCS